MHVYHLYQPDRKRLSMRGASRLVCQQSDCGGGRYGIIVYVLLLPLLHLLPCVSLEKQSQDHEARARYGPRDSSQYCLTATTVPTTHGISSADATTVSKRITTQPQHESSAICWFSRHSIIHPNMYVTCIDGLAI